MIPLLTIVIAAIHAFGAGQPGSNDAKKLMAQQLFQQTLAARHTLSLEAYIDRLKQVTKLDAKFAEAFHELGCAYLERGTTAGRRLAQTALERAIRLAPANAEYRYTLAQLYLQCELTGEAKSEFRAMMKINPADARPYYQLARFKEEDYFLYRDMVSPHENTTLYFYPFAEKDFAETERLLRTAITLDPKMAEAYHRLAALYYEISRYEEMADCLERGITHRPSADLFLFLGLARQQLGSPDEAMAAYEQALQLMLPPDRTLFYSLQPILAPDSLSIYKQHLDSLKAQMSQAAFDSLYIKESQNFWKARDPLFLTEANERLLEHFGRVAYANLRYSFPEKKIEGWKTDRGKTLIRFGMPSSQARLRADLGSTPTGRTSFIPRREIWGYGDFYLTFSDAFMNGNYEFAWGEVHRPATDGKWMFEHKIRKEPERYFFPHGGRRLDLPHVIAQFRADDSSGTELEIYFGIPESALQATDFITERQGRQYELRRGLFFFEANWNEIKQWREDRHISYRTPVEGITTPDYLIDRWPVRMPPGNYRFALEVMDKKSGHTGAEREILTIEDFSGEQLLLSSVVLAHAVRETSVTNLTLYNKSGISLIPSLFQQFSVNTPIAIYYEVYNLTLASSGQTRYRIDYIVEPVQAEKSMVSRAIERFNKFLQRGERNVAVTSSFEFSGISGTEKLYHSLELQGRPAGKYHLTIQLTDLISSQVVSRRTAFVVTAPERVER